MSLNIRMKQLRNALGLKRQEMADSFEMTVNSYYNIENDKTKKVSDKVKLILIEKYDVNLNWLIVGKGDMFIRGGLESKLDDMRKDLKEIKSGISELKND